MIIFIGGVHSAGKSTIINKVKLDIPIIKVVNLDMSKKVLLNNPGASNQFLRHELYFQTMHQLLKLPEEYIILVDRLPVSLTIYDQSLKDLGIYNDTALTELSKDYKIKYERYINELKLSSHTTYNVLLDIDKNILLDNIKERNRDASLREGDEYYLDLIINSYDKIKNIFDLILTSNNIDKKEMYKELLIKLEEFIKDKTNI